MNQKIKTILLCITLFLVITSLILIFNQNEPKQAINTWDIPITDELVSMINQNFKSVTAMDSEWIYFSENKTGSGINSPGHVYRMKHDGTEVEGILDTAAKNMLISDGYLYYLDSSNYSKLYALSLDDYSITLIYDGLVNQFILVDEWIYFCEESNIEYASQLSRVKHDGADYTVLISDKNCTNLMYTEGYIYFGSMDNLFSTYRMAVESFELELLLKDNELPYAIVENTLLTFKKGELKSLDLNTGISRKLLEIDLGDNVLDSFNFYHDICYGINANRELIKITEKGFKIIYNEFSVEYLNVVGDWLFFSVSNNPENIHERSLYRMNLKTDEISM